MTPLNILDISNLVIRMVSILPGLSRRPFWSTEKIQAYQLKMIRERITEAKAKVSLYKNLPDASEIKSLVDLTKIPILTKKDLLANDTSARLNPDYKFEDLIESKSSGSTGQALNVYYDRESFYLFVLAGLRLYNMAFKYMPWHHQTYIYTSEYPFDSLFGAYTNQFISTLAPITETIEALRKRPPHLLVCYPSHLRAIVDQMNEEDFKKIRPIAINVNSEMSSPAERKFLSEKLNSFVFDDYSSEELTRIASQCRELQYHIFDDINYIEVVDDDGKPLPEGVVGNLIGTNLHNRAMPLIRYMQGDRGAVRTKKCACGRNFRILEKLEGRRNDAFVLPDGKTVSSGFLLDLTYGVFLNYEDAVSAFCLLQEDPAVWQLQVVKGSKWNKDFETRLTDDLMRDLKQPQVRIELKIVDQVARTASGKSNPIISRIKKDS